VTDEVALTAILRNLLSNGIKYTDRGEVRLSTRVNGPRLEIIVADAGVAIPAGPASHVFGPREDDVAMIAIRGLSSGEAP
jgi:signal transduction histidine kinase